MSNQTFYTAKLQRGLLLSLCLCLVTVACSSRGTVSSKWLDKNSKRPGYDKALVVAVSATADRRKSFEDAVVKDLLSDNTQAWSSSSLMSPKTEITETSIRKAAADKGAKVIIVTRVTKLNVQTVEEGGRSKILAEEQQSGSQHVFKRKSGTLFQYDYKEDIESTYVTSKYSTELTTDVYDVNSDKPFYSIVAYVNKQETLTDVIDILSDKIAKRLRRDKIVK